MPEPAGLGLAILAQTQADSAVTTLGFALDWLVLGCVFTPADRGLGK